ncbi:hypothetical protein Tco_0172911 [Tanacetum coccineum]
MSTFIKNQSSWKLTQLKKLTFDELKTEFEKLVKSIENFVPMETDEREKRQGVQLEEEFSKKQKTIEEVSVLEESITKPVIAKEEEIEKSVKKREEREAFMKDKVSSASSESEIRIDAIPTAIKPPSIVDWKIIPQSGQKAVYQIIRRDGSDKIYMSFGAILKDFSRDDLTELYRLVIKKYGANRPKEMYDRHPNVVFSCVSYVGSVTVERIQGLKMDRWELVIDQGLRIEDDHAPKDLEASLPTYKYLRISHNVSITYLDFKAFDNNVLTTERVLEKNLQKFSSFLYAQLSEDNWAKHEEVSASYVDLRAVVEEYAEENDFNRNRTEKAINNTMEFIEKINKARVDERSTLLKSLNRVLETLEAD